MRLPIVAVLTVMSFAAPGHADPRPLTDADLRAVAGGFLDTYIVVPTVVINNATSSTAIGVGSANVQSTAISNIDVQNAITIAPGDQIVTFQPGAMPTIAGSAPSVAAPSLAASVSAPPVWVPWARELRGAFGPNFTR